MVFTDPADNSIMVDYDPFEDARIPVPVKEAEHAKDRNGQSTDSEPSGSPLTPGAVRPDPLAKAHPGEWESLDGPVYCNSSVRNEDGHTRHVNHFINAKLEEPKHKALSHENPRPNGPLPMMGKKYRKQSSAIGVSTNKNNAVGMMPEPLQHHRQVNYIDSTKTFCADCAAHEKGSAVPHHDNIFQRDFESLTEKVAHLEKELGVTILHLVHEGQSWVRKAHHHAKSNDTDGVNHELDLTRVGKVPSHTHPGQVKEGEAGGFWPRIAGTSPCY